MPNKQTPIKISVALAAMLVAVNGALGAPDAGSIQKEIEKNLEKQTPIQKKSEKIDTSLVDDKVKVKVKSFKFSGNTIVPTAELEKVTQPYIGQELGFNALQKIVGAVSDYYAQQGGLAKVYLPKQDITSGIVTIAIIEGKLNSVVVDNKEAKLGVAKAEKYIYAENVKGEPIKNKELSRALMNLNDLGGLRATSSLAPGAAEGSSDLVIKLKDTTKFSVDAGVDNYGSLSTGKIEFSAGANINNISSSELYDTLNIRAMATEGVRFARVGYSLPVGYAGDKVGVALSAMKYRLIEGNYNSTNGEGYSTTLSANWSHPFVRSKEFNINLNTEAAYKNYSNKVDSDLTSIKKVGLVTATLSADKADAFLGGGQNSASLALTYGKLMLSSLPSNFDTDQTSAKTDGAYLKYALNLSRTQLISDSLVLQGSLQAQASNKNLDSSEEISLGGAYAVRAYPTSEASGDMGYLASLELKHATTSELTTSIFADYGRIMTNKTQWDGASNVGSTLGGYGVGVSYATSFNLNIKAQAARRLITNYEGQANGNNSDGSKSTDNRYWLSATYFF
jgi:hemolysin activation/secretion protein